MQDHETGFPEYLRQTVKDIRETYDKLVKPNVPAKSADATLSRNAPSYFGKTKRGKNQY